MCFLYSLRSVISGWNFLELSHYFFVILFIVFEIFRLLFVTKSNLTEDLKGTVLSFFIFLILISKSKALILISIILFLFLLDNLFLISLFNIFELKEFTLIYIKKLSKLLRKILSLLCIFFIFLITLISFNPNFLTLSTLKLFNNISTNRIMINYSYLEYCSNAYNPFFNLDFNLEKKLPVLRYQDEREAYIHRQIQLSKLYDLRKENKFKPFLLNKIFTEKEFFINLNRFPHNALLSYLCFHPIVYFYFFLLFLCIMTLLALFNFGYQYILLFVISYLLLFFDYVPLIPACCIVVSSFISINSMIKLKLIN